jgi:serine/threonine protein phosphatase PrpC
VRQAVLRGRDHLEVGEIGAVSEGAVAIAISKGGAPKTYQHTDPNEDAAAFAIGAGGVFAAVADGHNGAEGAETALQCLLSDYAPAWTAAESALRDEAAWQESVWEALLVLNTAILKGAAERSVQPPGTTLSIAIARPGEDRFVHAAIGDSPLFELARGGRLFDLGFEALRNARSSYLGHQAETPESIRANCAVGCRPLGETRAITLATDGLSEPGIGVVDPASAVVEVAEQAADKPLDLRPLETARGVVQAALQAHRENRAGDNAAAAVIWLEQMENP